MKLSIPGRAAGCADLTLFWRLAHNGVTLCTRDRECEWTPRVQKWPCHPLRHRPGVCCGLRTQSSIRVMVKPTTTGAFLVQMIILKTNKKTVGPRICWCVSLCFQRWETDGEGWSQLLHCQGSGSAFWFELCLLNVKPFPLSFLAPPTPVSF